VYQPGADFQPSPAHGRAGLKSLPRRADASRMRLDSLSIETWFAIGLVIAWMVLLSLRTLATCLDYELSLHQLKLDTRRLRREYSRRLGEFVAELQAAEGKGEPAEMEGIRPAP
jgi:hypothetical protein